MAAAQGSAKAQNNLGLMYKHGKGVPRDMEKAAELYTMAMEQGHLIAQFNLGALTKLVPILLGGARTTSRQASLERRSRFAARTESELLGIIFEQLEAVAAETLGGPPY